MRSLHTLKASITLLFLAFMLAGCKGLHGPGGFGKHDEWVLLIVGIAIGAGFMALYQRGH